MATSLFAFGSVIRGVTKGLTSAMSAITALATIGTGLETETLLSEFVGSVPRVGNTLSANAIIREVRGMGFHVQRSAALDVIRQVKAQIANRSYVKGLTHRQLPKMTELAYSPFRITSKYQYMVSIIGTDPITGELSQRWITVASDKLITKAAAEELAISSIIGEERYNMEDIRSASVENILRRAEPIRLL